MQGVSKDKRITIFTTFSEISEAYSLNRVVLDQLKMLLEGGYKPTVITADSFEPKGLYAHEDVTIKTVPMVPVHNEIKKDETFDQDIKDLQAALEPILKESDVVITHDLVYQPAALKHNIAARAIADKYPEIKWLHWIHSATSPYTLANLKPYFEGKYQEVLSKKFPNSFYVFFNHYSVPRIAQEFSVTQDEVRVVHHPSDVAKVFGLTKNVEEFAKKNNLYEADAISITPVRLDRGKQVEMVIKTMAMLKEFGLKVKVIIVDFHSIGGDKVSYRDDLKSIGIDWGLSAGELIWTSEYSDEWTAEVDHEDVLSLMRLSNVFIQPSRSESYSLTTQEAGMNKCVMVLNFDFPPFRDIFGPNAIFRKYSSNIDIMNGMGGNTNTDYGPGDAAPEERKAYEKRYHLETAGMIASKLSSYKDLAMATFLRKNRNLQTVFKKELEPLIYEEMK